jgi:hypothetical protein
VTPGVEIVTGVVHGSAAGRFAVSIALPADELCSQTPDQMRTTVSFA